MIIEQQMNLLTPKYEIIQKILKIMKEYETRGAEKKIRIYDTNDDEECKSILEEWEKHLNDWTKMMNDLRTKYKYLCYFTVNEMRFVYRR